MAKPKAIDPKAWLDLLAQTRALGLGATEAYPGFFPEGLGITRRTEPRNTLRGTVMTKPEPFVVMIGVTYWDKVDNGDNEDMLKVNEQTLEITPMTPAEFAKEYPEYV